MSERDAAQARADEIDDALVEGRRRRGVAVGALGRGWGPWEAADAGSLVLAALQGEVRPLAKAWEAVRHRRIALRADIVAELGRRSTDERAQMRLLAAANGLLVEAIDLAEPAAGELVTAGSTWLLNTIPFEEPAPLQREERWCVARVVDALPGAAGQRCRVEVVEGPLVGRRLEVPRAALRTADEVLGADRLLSDQHETALRSLERGDGNADAVRRQARTWLGLLERTAEQLATAREVMLFHEALAAQAQHDRDVLRVVVPQGRIEGELAEANEARARSGELLFALQGHVGDLVRALRRATDLDEAERIVRWNMAEGEAGRGARRAMLREERMDAPALGADRAVLAKAANLESSAVARESNPPTAEERRGAERKVLESTGRPVRADRPPSVNLRRTRNLTALLAGLASEPAVQPAEPAPRRAPRSPAARGGSTQAARPLPIVCDICHQRSLRAPDASQDICAPCLQIERIKSGVEEPPALLALDADLRPLREALTFDRWVPPGRVPSREEMEAARWALWDARRAHEQSPTPRTARALDAAERYYRRLFDTNKAVADRIEADRR